MATRRTCFMILLAAANVVFADDGDQKNRGQPARGPFNQGAPAQGPRGAVPAEAPRRIVPAQVPRGSAPAQTPRRVAPTQVPRATAPVETPRRVIPTQVPRGSSERRVTPTEAQLRAS
ncbi:MAG: hypothetical protein LLG04_11990, partial [Parachlamydia sp.]|nr:hypothetical protein [Parachlamydia sp.]